MIETIVKLITIRIIRYGGAKEKDLPIIQYGIQAMIEMLFISFTMLIVSILFNQILEGLAWMGTVIIIRSLGGGRHAKTFGLCYIISNAIFVVSLLIVHVLSRNPELYCWIGLTVSLCLMVLIVSPHCISRQEKLYKIYVIVITLYTFLSVGILFFENGNSILLSSILGTIIAKLSNCYWRKKENGYTCNKEGSMEAS